MEDDSYITVGKYIGVIVGFLVFVGCWIYCIVNYGFLLGVGLGWLPSIITAVIVGYLLVPFWGLILLAIGIGILVLMNK